LRRLGRTHSARDAERAVAAARSAGFANLGLDLIYGVPGQSTAGLDRDLDRLLALRPEHVSAYALELEPDTPLGRRAARGEVAPASDDDAADQFARLRARLRAAGYAQYELSNFCRPGFECRHNRLYWSGGEYLGVGPAAHSHWRGARWGNFRTPEEWASALSEARNPRAFEERLDAAAHARETLVFGLRRLAGWDREEFRRRTGFDYEALRGAEIAALAARGLLVRTPRRIRLAARALFTSDAVFAELV
jgi:oxygen-independent coproporphyrinogen-3 oxidase